MGFHCPEVTLAGLGAGADWRGASLSQQCQIQAEVGCEGPALSQPSSRRGGSPRSTGRASAHCSDGSNPVLWWQWAAVNLQQFHASAQRVAELCCLCVDKASAAKGRLVGMGGWEMRAPQGIWVCFWPDPQPLRCCCTPWGRLVGFLSLLMLFGLSLQSGQFNEDMIPTVGFNMRKITKGNVTIKVRCRRYLPNWGESWGEG